MDPRGREAESMAVDYLKKKSYSIVERNFRWKGGEIDIIARDGKELVFVEVRSLRKELLNPIETVGYKKQKSIIQTAKVYLTAKKIEGTLCRFDVIGIMFKDKKTHIEHIKNAFWE